MQVVKRQRVVFENPPKFSTLVDAEIKHWLEQLKPLHPKTVFESTAWMLHIYPPVGNEHRGAEHEFRLSDLRSYFAYMNSETVNWSPIVVCAETREMLKPRNHPLLWLAGVTFTIMPYGTSHKLTEEYFRRPLPDPKLRGPRDFMGERVDFTCAEQLERLYRASVQQCTDLMCGMDEAAMDTAFEKELEAFQKLMHPKNFPFKIPEKTILDELEEWDPWK